MKTLKEIQTLYTNSAELTVFDKTLQISAQRSCYTQLYKKYRSIADSLYERYLPIDKDYKKIEDLINDAPTSFNELINTGIDEVVKDAISIGLITTDAKIVKTQCKNGWYFSPFYDVYNQLENSYNTYNAIVKDSKEDMVFAATLSTSVAASVGGKALQKNAQAKAQLKELQDNLVQLRSNLREGFRSSCLNLHYYMINSFSEESCFDISGFPNKNSIEKAAGIYRNLLQTELSAEQKKEFICSILELNPYNDKYYVSFAEMFPENTAQFMKASTFFGTTALKDHLNGILSAFVSNNIGTTEDDAYKCRNELDVKVAEYGMDRVTAAPTYRIIEQRLALLDLEYRTVQGVVLDTREAADVARNDIDTHKDILENPPQFIYRKDYTAYIEKIRNLPIRPEISAEYAKRYSEKLEEFDKQCIKALRYHYITIHHNPFWNGDKKDMLLHYGIAAVLLLMGIIFMISNSAPGFIVLAAGVLIYTVVIKPLIEKKVWNALTHNGQYKIEDIAAGSSILTIFNH